MRLSYTVANLKTFRRIMKKNFFYYASISILMGLCLSAGWYHHYIRHLPLIAQCMPTFDPKQKTVEVHVRALSSEESSQLLGHNLPSQGIQPVYVMIENNSPHEYSICPDSIDLNHIEAKKVAEKIKRLALPRTIAFKVLGFLFWPFMIPGTIDTIHTFHSYKLLKQDYAAKSMKEEIVPVYSTVNRILFVPVDDFKDTFTVTLTERGKQKSEIFEISKPEQSTNPAENVS